MTLETFTRFIEGLEKYQEKRDKAYGLGIYYREVVRLLISEVFKEEGVDWINWYLYERSSVTGEKLKAFDKDGNEICFDIPSLYDTIKEYLQ